MKKIIAITLSAVLFFTAMVIGVTKRTEAFMPLTIDDVMLAIRNYHTTTLGGTITRNQILTQTNTSRDCTGVIATATASVDVIKRAKAEGVNLIITHAPSFYSWEDNLGTYANNAVFKEKKKLIDDAGITIWRLNANYGGSDFINYGFAKTMGWESHLANNNNEVNLPFARTVKDVTKEMVQKLNLNGGCYVGLPDSQVKKIAIGYNLADNDNISLFNSWGYDTIIATETKDWTTPNYALDATQLGRDCSIINVGANNYKDAGMKYAASEYNKLFTFAGGVPVKYVQSGDMYTYIKGVPEDKWEMQHIQYSNTMNSTLTHSQVIDKIKKYHAPSGTLPYGGGDNWDHQATNVNTTVTTGIITTQNPSIALIHKAHELGANLIITHEPPFAGGSVETQKKALLNQYGISVHRNHDHAHQHCNPEYPSKLPGNDGIAGYADHIFWTGGITLGWENNFNPVVNGIQANHQAYSIQKQPIMDIAEYMALKTNLMGGRIAGNTKGLASEVCIGSHNDGDASQAINFLDDKRLDVVAPNETRDNLASLYCQDDGQLGLTGRNSKAIIQFAHYNLEEFGMNTMAKVFNDRIFKNTIPLIYIQGGGAMWRFVYGEQVTEELQITSVQVNGTAASDEISISKDDDINIKINAWGTESKDGKNPVYSLKITGDKPVLDDHSNETGIFLIGKRAEGSYTVIAKVTNPDGKFAEKTFTMNVVDPSQITTTAGTTTETTTDNSTTTNNTTTTKTPPQKGDINLDGKINGMDLLLMKQHILDIPGKNITPDTDAFFAADMNDDGKINGMDLLLLKKKILA